MLISRRAGDSTVRYPDRAACASIILIGLRRDPDPCLARRLLNLRVGAAWRSCDALACLQRVNVTRERIVPGAGEFCVGDYDLVIRGGTVVTAANTVRGRRRHPPRDHRDGRRPPRRWCENHRRVRAAGAPGGIDSHVHLAQPSGESVMADVEQIRILRRLLSPYAVPGGACSHAG